MIRRSGRWLVWDVEDEIPVTRIIGPDQASKGRAPVWPSILKKAKESGIRLDKQLEEKLIENRRVRVELKRLRKLEDVPNVPGYDPDVVARLFPHQRVALAYMDRFHSYLLADQPGVGKTPVAILWAERRMKGRTLVIAPNSAKKQWEREIRRWRSTNFPVSVIEGRLGNQEEIALRDGWVIGHWQTLTNIPDALTERSWDVVILDEAHAIRNRKTMTAQNAFSLVSRHRLAMTGHPYVNAPDELYSILHFLYPNLYSSFWAFWSMHIEAKAKFFGGFDILGARDPKLLRWEIAPISLRRTKRRVFKSLPEITRVPRYVELSASARAEYNRLRKEFFVELESHDPDDPNVLAIPSVLARVTRLRQYLVDPGLLGAKAKSPKYPEVLALINELDGPPVVFTMFREAAEALGLFLQDAGLRTGAIHGKVSERDRDRAQRRFLKGKLDALIVSTQAGGTALNLGKYGYVIFLDLPWTAMDLEQAEARVDRPEEGTGRLVPTTSFRIIVENSYEVKQEKILETKKSMFDEVFNAGQLKSLFS